MHHLRFHAGALPAGQGPARGSAPHVEFAELVVQQRAQLLPRPAQGRFDIGVAMGDGLRLHALGPRLDHASDIIGPTLGPIHIDQVHFNARKAIGQMPQRTGDGRLGNLGQTLITLNMAIGVELELHYRSPLC